MTSLEQLRAVEHPEEEVEDLTNPEVLNKYKATADVANAVMSQLVQSLAPGKSVVDLCTLGDNLILEKLASVLKKKKDIPKGVAFPTCINVNTIVCHFSPSSAADNVILKQGDSIRIDLGVHVDGYIAVVAHTVMLTDQLPIVGKTADLMAAAQNALDAAVRLIKPGHTNTEVSDIINQVAAEYQVHVVEGVLSHQMKRFVIDGNKVILAKPTTDQKAEEFQFQENEVYGLDIVVSSAEGRLREKDFKPFIYKRAVDSQYDLKMKSSRQLMSEIIHKFHSMPFNLRWLSDQKAAKMGIVECWRHNLVDPYPVLCCQSGEVVVHLKLTVAVTPTSVIKLTGHPLQQHQSQLKITSTNVKQILATGLSIKKKPAAASGPTPMDID